MHLTPAEIADRAVVVFIAITQFFLGRLLYRRGLLTKPTVPSRLLCVLLGTLWVMIAVDLVMSFMGAAYSAPWLPRMIRSACSGIGIAWGVTTAASLIVFLLYERLVARLPAPYSPRRRELIRTAGALAVAAPFAVSGFGAIIERTSFHVKQVDLPVPNLHPDLEGKLIAQISDLHVSPFLSVREAGRVVDMTNELKPHLTVITGDLITQAGDPLDETIAELARLRAEAGVLGCLGNHEQYAHCENYTTSAAARRGMDFLRDRARVLRWGNGVLNIAGVDYQSKRQGAYLTRSAGLVVPGAANLLLSHNPDVFPVAARQGYDAMLAGHTHGGQVTVEILNQTLNFARFATPFVAGLYRIDGRSCYVTAGIGTIGMPVRIGAPPEITLLRLTRG